MIINFKIFEKQLYRFRIGDYVKVKTIEEDKIYQIYKKEKWKDRINYKIRNIKDGSIRNEYGFNLRIITKEKVKMLLDINKYNL